MSVVHWSLAEPVQQRAAPTLAAPSPRVALRPARGARQRRVVLRVQEAAIPPAALFRQVDRLLMVERAAREARVPLGPNASRTTPCLRLRCCSEHLRRTTRLRLPTAAWP